MIRQYKDGSWSSSEPWGYQSWKAKLEQFFYVVHFRRLAQFMGRWDERGLGK